MKENVRFWSKYRVVTPYFDCLMKWNCVMKVWKKSELMLMRGKRKTVRFSVRLWLLIWTVILLDPLLFLLDRSSCVFLGWGWWGWGVWIHLLLLLHIYTLPIIWPSLTSFKTMFNIVYELASFKTMFNIVYELASFKTMFNIVYELASFKTIICSRGG